MKISCRVTPRSSRDKVEKVSETHFKVWVTASPTDNQANEAVRALLAKHFGVAKSRVVLVRGATSREKGFEIR